MCTHSERYSLDAREDDAGMLSNGIEVLYCHMWIVKGENLDSFGIATENRCLEDFWYDVVDVSDIFDDETSRESFFQEPFNGPFEDTTDCHHFSQSCRD